MIPRMLSTFTSPFVIIFQETQWNKWQVRQEEAQAHEWQRTPASLSADWDTFSEQNLHYGSNDLDFDLYSDFILKLTLFFPSPLDEQSVQGLYTYMENAVKFVP